MKIIDAIPVRYVLAMLAFFTMCVQYAHRVILSVAIVAMVNTTSFEDDNFTTVSKDCPHLHNHRNITFNYKKSGEYDWSPSVQGVLLGSFFYGLVLGQLFAGWIIRKVGAKKIFVGSTLISSISVLIIPLITDFGVVPVTLARTVTGISQGLGFPSMYTLIARWSPITERSTMLAICISGNSIGNVVCMMLTGYLCEYGFAGGWPSTFYVLGMSGCIVTVFLFFLVFDSPNVHPRITKRELLIFAQEKYNPSNEKNIPIPWKNILTSQPVWAVAIVKFCWAWGYYTLLTKLPVYLETVLHYPIHENGYLNALFHTAEGACSVTSGFLADYLRNRRYFTITTIRKMFETLGMLGPSICLILVPLAGCNNLTVVILLTLALGLFGMTGGGDFPIVVDLAPALAATLYSFTNSAACVSALLSPLVAGLLLDEAQASMEKWCMVFYCSAGIYAFGAIMFVLMASADLQPWAVSPSTDETSRKDDKNIEVFTVKTDHFEKEQNR